MKKYVLTLALLTGAAAAYAQDDTTTAHAIDHAQPVPDASITTKKTSETTATLLDSSGNQAVNITKSVTVGNSKIAETATVAHSELILPEPQIIDPELTLPQTLQKMRSAFQALVAAEDIDALKTPANTLTKYTDQAYVLVDQGADVANLGNLGDREQVLSDLQALRGLLVELRRAIVNNDFALAKTKVDIIDQAQDGLYAQLNAQ